MSDAGAKMYDNDRKRTNRRRLEFACNTQDLKAWIDKRVQALKKVRAEFEPLWKELRSQFEPNIGKALLEGDRDQEAAKRDDRKILTSYPRKLAHQYAAGMQSGITNQAQPWVEFVPQTAEERVKESKDLKKWFALVTRRVLDAMQRGNVYQTTDQVYLHSGIFGTSCSLLLHGDRPGEVFMHLIDEGDYWIAENRFQRVDTCLRRIEMTIAQAAEEFMYCALPESWQKKYDDGQHEDRVTIWNLVCPNGPRDENTDKLFRDVPAEAPFASFYFTEGASADDNSGILKITHFTYNPIIAYRHFYCGSVYGKGLGEMSLADCKELQKLEECKLRMIQNEVSPAMIAPSSMKGLPINMYPGGITYVDQLSATTGAPIQRLFQTRESLEALAAQIQIVEQRAGDIWYQKLFAMMLNISTGTNRQITAREVNELNGEKVTLLGPVLTRMNHDFLSCLTDGIFTMLLEDGLLEDEQTPIPPSVVDGPNGEPPEVRIGTEFTSAIHTEMLANLHMKGILKTLDVAAMVMQAIPSVVTKIDGDQIIDEIGNIYRSTAPIIRSDKEANEIRAQQRQEQERQLQQAQLAEMAKNAGTQAKALAETPVGNGNALDAVLNAGGLE